MAPALVLVLAGAQTPAWEHAPWYLAALVVQLAGDALIAIARARLSLGVRPVVMRHELALIYRVDVLLAPIGLLAAFGAAEQPYAALLVLPLVALFGLFAREREARIDGAIELSQAYKGTALLLGDVIEADDQYTGRAHEGRRRAHAAGRRRARRRRARRAAARSSARCCTTSARSASRRRSSTSPGRWTTPSGP